MLTSLRKIILANTFTSILMGITLAVYALLLSGVTASYVEAVSVCTTWPTCDGSWVIGMGDTDALIAMGHRVFSVLVGLALLGATMWSWLRSLPPRVRWTLTGIVAIYPLQIALGAVTVSLGGHALISALHLLVAVVIFFGTLLALLFWLEWETRDIDSSYTSSHREPSADSRGADERASTTLRATVWAYLQLTKPRLMWLLCIVALAGMGLATVSSGIALTWQMVVGTLLGGVLAIGASGTFNHVIERDVDHRMGRTADRPVTTGEVSARRAIVFGVGLMLASVLVFLSLVNVIAMALALLAIGFYSIVYTVILKPHTTQNIVIGGAVGALPALIGWAAVTGSIGLPAVVLGLIIFLWTPAHFYNLALAYQRDYERGGFPMLPVARGEQITHRHIVLYFGATLVGVGMLSAVASVGWLFTATAIMFAGIFLLAVVNLFRHRSRPAALTTFHTSNAFLGVLMLVIILETIVL